VLFQLGDDDFDIEAAHEGSEAADTANPLFSSYEASEVNESEAEDALFQFGDGDSDIEAAHEAGDIYIDIDRGEGELQSDAYSAAKDTDSTFNS
jgi:hypothetical protein